MKDGLIPAYTECPYRGKCEIAKGNQCKHYGVLHKVQYSCAAARWFQMQDKRIPAEEYDPKN